ncbi:two-component regulator propeller domain-containing protein [Urechidicola croceus]|uniref:histidine kinase n=1 Tax=Urechidicola croceus TaxID=1850246 RepID=A0A1D8PAP0_9FLAO|nr:two-component regulator propeller domain-containing protein [Urechidicola croceus]AOW21632.1 hybrid sensor histidine kinase/response regulator [Urechidicola croceus]
MNKVITLFTAFIFQLPILSQEIKLKETLNNKVSRQISFNHLTLEQGLSQNSVMSIAQDSIGFMWFATQDGLNKYDGTTFKHYNKLFEDITRSTYSKLGKVYIDRENTLWIISNSGILEKFDMSNEVFQIIPNINDVSTIFQDSNLNTYIGTFNDGLYKINSNSKDTIQLFDKKDFNNSISGIIQDNNNLLVTTLNNIYQLNIGSNEYTTLSTLNTYYSSIAKIKNDSIFVGSYGSGLFLKDKKSNTFQKFHQLGDYSLPKNLNIQSLLTDSNNRLWVATYGNGVYLLNFKTETIKHFLTNKNNPYALHYNDVLSLYEDNAGTIWLGTDGAGLSYYDQYLSKFNVLTNYQTPVNVYVDVIRSIVVDPNTNDIWLGTSGKGLTKINLENQDYKTFTTNNSTLNSNRIVGLNIIDNELWIGHQDVGLEILDTLGNYTTYNKNSKIKLNASTIWSIYKDSKNRNWICTRENGLFLFDKKVGVLDNYKCQINNFKTLPSNNIRAIAETKNGILWIGTDDNGICSLNPETKEIIRYSEISDKIKSLYFDEKNQTLWVGTFGNGLKSFNIHSKKVLSYTTENGLPNNVIYGILPDKNNNLWLSSNRGITKFSLDKIDTPTITNYNNYDGLQAFEFNTGAYFKDTKDILYFGGLEGLNWFNPNQLTTNPTKPQTVITKLEIYSEEQKITQNKEFKHNQNTVTFTFAGLHYSLPERNNYQYQLVNHDVDWINSGNNNIAHYPKLEPNTYTFRVKSSNYDNVWNNIPAEYKFTIMQPWYLSRWAKLFYILCTLFTLFAIYRYFNWRWYMKLQLELEHKETERLKQLDELKTKLYANISHEFRTPLTLISGPVERQLSNPKLSIKDKKELSIIKNNSKRLLNLVNQLLDLSKIESGSTKLSITQGNLGLFIKQLVNSFEYKADEKRIKFSSKIVESKNAWFDKDIIEKLITNLLENAIKYAPENGFVHFESSIQDGQLIISILNNGNTISTNDLPKLFERFYQSNKHSVGVGIGLSLVKELTTLYRGSIMANTMNEDQIQFTLNLPIDKSYFNENEILENKELQHTNINPNKKTPIKHDETPILLIVEDNKDIREYITSIFLNDYSIIQEEDGEKGIQTALKHIPDIIISDVMMPIKDGLELSKTLKNDEKTSHIPIILLTAKVGEENQIEGIKTGADDYITKPFNENLLKLKVQKLIESRKKLQERYSHEFVLKPKDITITTTDEKFLKRIQKVLDNKLIESDFNSEVFSNTLGMSRMQLHRKLKGITGLSTSEFIKTQRLKLATQLLKNKDINVSEVGYSVGFNDHAYFSKCFKQTYSCTPSEYSMR